MNKYQVWTCKIIVSGDAELPNGFDAPPRSAAIEAIENKGISVLGCASGWGGSLSKSEQEILEEGLCEHGRRLNDYCEPCGRIHSEE